MCSLGYTPELLTQIFRKNVQNAVICARMKRVRHADDHSETAEEH